MYSTAAQIDLTGLVHWRWAPSRISYSEHATAFGISSTSPYQRHNFHRYNKNPRLTLYTAESSDLCDENDFKNDPLSSNTENCSCFVNCAAQLQQSVGLCLPDVCASSNVFFQLQSSVFVISFNLEACFEWWLELSLVHCRSS